jgi:DNA polymerase-1
VKRTILALKKIGYKINEKQFVFDTKSAIYVLDPEAGNKPEKQLLRFTEIDFIEDDELIFGKGMKRTVECQKRIHCKENFFTFDSNRKNHQWTSRT